MAQIHAEGTKEAGEHPLKEGLVQRTYWMADRGERPLTRGWGHALAALLSVIASTVLITYAVSYTHLTLPTKA